MTAAQGPAATSAAEGEAGAASNTVGRQARPHANHRRRWPIWSEPHPRLTVPCNICGFGDGHSSVCPFGPMP